MRPQEPSGQTARLLRVKSHPKYPNHILVTAGAETFCQAAEKSFSGKSELILCPGEQVTFTVARDVFAGRCVGQALDGAWLAYYAMRGQPTLAA